MAIQDVMLLFRQTFFDKLSQCTSAIFYSSQQQKNATPAACMIYLYTSDDNEMNMCICTFLVHVILLKIITYMELFLLLGRFLMRWTPC